MISAWALPACRSAAGSLAQHILRGTSCNSFSAAFSSASSASTSPMGKASSFLSWLPSHSPRIAVPLTQALPGVTAEQPFRSSLLPPPTETTVLPNGVRIVSENSPGPTASLGIYVNSGTIYESLAESGSSAMLECLAFKSTKHRSTLRIAKEVEKIGSNVMASASREQMSYTIDCLKSNAPAALELLCDCVVNPSFEAHEVDEQRHRLAMLLDNKDLAMTFLNEKLIMSAYKGALAKPLIPSPEQLAALTPETLAAFVAQHYRSTHLVLAAAGIEHKRLVELAAPMLEGLPHLPLVQEPRSTYQGGYVHMDGSFPQANVTLAFEYAGGWRDVKAAVNMTVLTYLLGGGNSFSSGGPGKGMHSRLYTRVLNQYAWVSSCTAFNSTFNDSGLVGITAQCAPNCVHEMLNVMATELDTASMSLNRVELERAKRATASVICNALESKATSAEDIGRQLLTYGKRISGRQYVEMIEAVTVSDITSFVRQLLRSKPSLALYGDNTDSISYDAVASRFG